MRVGAVFKHRQVDVVGLPHPVGVGGPLGRDPGAVQGTLRDILALARELGWGFEEKLIVAQPWELLANLGLRVTLARMDRGASSPLRPPWPDLVITVDNGIASVEGVARARARGISTLITDHHLPGPELPAAEGVPASNPGS